MSAIAYRFLEPLDVLFLRGNKLFGDPGSFGESLVPPWPSVAAGAIRSRMLADAGTDLAAFARGEIHHPTLGTPESPGPFRVTAFHLARRRADGTVEVLVQPPADLVIAEDPSGNASVRALTPTLVAGGEGLSSSSPHPLGEAPGLRVGISCSAPLPLLPVLAERERSKPASGYWLNEAGWKSYLAGRTPRAADLVRASELWSLDHRVGVGLAGDTGRAADGRLFSVQAVAMRAGSGFLAAIRGAEPPKSGTLRLGGDGRAAALSEAKVSVAELDYASIAKARRCRLVLITPGLFSSPLPAVGEGRGERAGWLPNGIRKIADGAWRFDLHGVKGRLVCAVVPRAEVVSGWDLAQWRPKTAQRAAPAGSVYWLDPLEARPEDLRKLAENGLWSDSCEDASRCSEGFNRCALAAWTE